MVTQGPMIIPNYNRLQFPFYNGIGDLWGWIYRCKQFFINQQIEEKDKVGLAAFYMTKEAQLRCYRLEQEEPGLNWAHLNPTTFLGLGPH